MMDAVRYRKKTTVDAVQWKNFGDHPAVNKYEDIMILNVGAPPELCDECNLPYFKHGLISTLENNHAIAQRVCPGDWILTGVKGEHYPCKPDIFAITYEAIS